MKAIEKKVDGNQKTHGVIENIIRDSVVENLSKTPLRVENLEKPFKDEKHKNAVLVQIERASCRERV